MSCDCDCVFPSLEDLIEAMLDSTRQNKQTIRQLNTEIMAIKRELEKEHKRANDYKNKLQKLKTLHKNCEINWI